MSRGRVEKAADLDPLFADETVDETYSRETYAKPRAEPATHTVFIVVESSDSWPRTYWTVKELSTKKAAMELAEEVVATIHGQLGIEPERLED